MRRMLAIAATVLLLITSAQFSAAQTPARSSHSYLGFDRNIYPGDEAMSELRKTFSFTSYWLSPPPEEKENTWRGKRELLRAKGFGFVVLYAGRASEELKTDLIGRQKGNSDARAAVAAAKNEGFTAGTIIFLDIEEGGRLPSAYHSYLRTWTAALTRAGFRSGVYCSAIPHTEGPGVSITTADDIHNHAIGLDIAFWVYNFVCPPSPGCDPSKTTLASSASGIPFAIVWQFAQTPKRKEFTANCPANDQPNGNCYAPTDAAHKWFLDLNSAVSPDPSNGRNRPHGRRQRQNFPDFRLRPILCPFSNNANF